MLEVKLQLNGKKTASLTAQTYPEVAGTDFTICYQKSWTDGIKTMPLLCIRQVNLGSSQACEDLVLLSSF